MHKDDLELVSSILKDNNKFEEFIDKYNRELSTFVYKRVRKKEQAQDIVQDIYIKIYRYLYSYNGITSLRTWMYIVARSVLYSFWRKKADICISLDDEEFSESTIIEIVDEDYGEVDIFKKVLSSLKQEDQDLLSMIYFDYMTYEEVSDILKVPEATLRNKVFRIKTHLRKLIKNYGD